VVSWRGFSEASYYLRRSKFGGMAMLNAKRLLPRRESASHYSVRLRGTKCGQ